jgi:hypothetical protein
LASGARRPGILLATGIIDGDPVVIVVAALFLPFLS